MEVLTKDLSSDMSNKCQEDILKEMKTKNDKLEKMVEDMKKDLGKTKQEHKVDLKKLNDETEDWKKAQEEINIEK